MIKKFKDLKFVNVFATLNLYLSTKEVTEGDSKPKN